MSLSGEGTALSEDLGEGSGDFWISAGIGKLLPSLIVGNLISDVLSRHM